MDARAGAGEWTRPRGYGELGAAHPTGRQRGYDDGEFAPGGDASTRLHMGYRDYGEGQQPPKRASRWRREPVRAHEIMTRDPRSVGPDAGLRDIARVMRDENTGIVPVCDDSGRLLGVITDRDVIMRTLAESDGPIRATARSVMTDDVEAVTPDESLKDVIELMGERQIRRVPVVERGNRLVGIISMADIATRADADSELQDALEDISARRSFWSRIF
jgi:CBS domain-containing protein